MAHFAKLNDNNVVEQVIVVDNDDIKDNSGIETESVGVGFCTKIFGADTKWKQTSYTRKFRKQYASAGGTYDEGRDVFIDPRPTGIYNEVFNSWVYNEVTGDWDPPTPYPDDGELYSWNEETITWEIYVE